MNRLPVGISSCSRSSMQRYVNNIFIAGSPIANVDELKEEGLDVYGEFVTGLVKGRNATGGKRKRSDSNSSAMVI